jgi:hypothetical protein
VKLTVSPSDIVTDLDGVKVRLWPGTTESGIAVTLAVRALIVHEDEDCAQFERELTVQLPPLEGFKAAEALSQWLESQRPTVPKKPPRAAKKPPRTG